MRIDRDVHGSVLSCEITKKHGNPYESLTLGFSS
jgi:hypothetical protein